MKHKHRPCPCGCGELADECMQPISACNALGAFQIAPMDGCPCGAAFSHGPHDTWDARPTFEDEQ